MLFSPKLLRVPPRRPVPPISGLGLAPTTQDRIVICILGVPISGITVIAQPQCGNLSSGIVNLLDLPASITSSRRLPFFYKRCPQSAHLVWFCEIGQSRQCVPSGRAA